MIVLDENGNIYVKNYGTVIVNAVDGGGSAIFYFWYEANKRYIVTASSFVNGRWSSPNEIRFSEAELTELFSPDDFILPDSTTVIDESAFEGISASAVVISAGCEEIRAHAFASSTVRQISLPKNCSIDSTAFEDCPNLTVIIVPEGGTSQTWAEIYVSNHSSCMLFFTE